MSELAGHTVLITTTPERTEWVTRVHQRGGQALLDPLQDYQEVDPGPLRAAVAQLRAGHYDWLVLTSARAVAALAAVGGEAQLTGVRATVAVVGAHTAARARAAGLHVTLIPGTATAAGLLAQWPHTAHGRVLLPLSDLAPTTLERGLAAFGMRPQRLTAYRVVPLPPTPAALNALGAEEVSAAVVTSASTARRLAALPEEHGVRLPALVIAIGEPTAAAARQVGLTVSATSPQPDPRHTIDTLVAALAAEQERP